MKSITNFLHYLKLRYQEGNVDRAWVREWIQPPLLDVGCGDGWLLEGPGERLGIEAGKQQFSVPDGAIDQDITDPWEVPSEHFRTVSLVHVIEHVLPEGAIHLLEEAHRVLREEGRFILATPSVHYWQRSIHHLRPYPPESIRRWVNRTEGITFRMVDRVDLGWSRQRWFRPLANLMTMTGLRKPRAHLTLWIKEGS